MSLRWLGSLTVLVLLLLGYWWLGSTDGALDPRMVEQFEQHQKPLLDQLTSASGEARDRLWRELRDSFDQLPEQQRDQTWQLIRQEIERREDERLQAFFKLTREQQLVELDKRIDEMERARERFAARESAGGGRPEGGGGPGGGTAGRGDRGPGGRSRDPSSRQRFTQRYVNNSSAEQRAMRTEYFSLIAERRKERGLPELPPWGGSGGPPGAGGPRGNSI